MKVRLGFVSNSSSEAFICNTEKPTEQIEKELRELLALYSKMTEQPYIFEEVFESPVKAENDDTSLLEDYLGYYRERPPLFFTPQEERFYDLKGKTIIYSASDNTIPWSLFEIIEDAYKATRIHLG